MILSHQATGQMRRHQPQKADHPVKGGNQSRHQGGHDHAGQPDAMHADTQPFGDLIAGGQGVQVPSHGCQEKRSQQDGHRQQPDFAPVGAGHVAEGPENHLDQFGIRRQKLNQINT